MKFLATGIEGAHLIELEPHVDERGYLARIWSHEEFRSRGLNADLSESSLSFSRLRGTLRGMHYQVAPHEEAKLVMCVRGLIYDVIVDLRKDSDTHLKWFATELSLENGRLQFVPEGVEGRVTYKGPLAAFAFQVVGGIRSGMGYSGCAHIEEMWTKARFVRVTPAGMQESHPHDIAITREAPNYLVQSF